MSILQATTQIGQTTLCNILGQSELDELLAERKKINRDLQAIIPDGAAPGSVAVHEPLNGSRMQEPSMPR